MKIGQQLREEDLCLWIDPLDCTSGFANNRLELVTILVGVSWRGRPILGFIGHPFDEEDGLCLYRPTIIMGSPLLESSCCYEYFLDSDEWKVIHLCENQTPKTTLVSCRNIGERQHEIMEKL
jgi:3'-phosphoadenosine 5'-phosphosulfate (PAPS) 3'-phosphatase